MGIQLPDSVENIVGKEEIARHEQFFFCHNVFKNCLLLMRQNEYLWSSGLIDHSSSIPLHGKVVGRYPMNYHVWALSRPTIIPRSHDNRYNDINSGIYWVQLNIVRNTG